MRSSLFWLSEILSLPRDHPSSLKDTFEFPNQINTLFVANAV